MIEEEAIDANDLRQQFPLSFGAALTFDSCARPQRECCKRPPAFTPPCKLLPPVSAASASAPAGEQEKPAENMEEVHAATARSGSQAAAARNGHLEVSGASEAAVGPALPVEEEAEPLVGPVLPSEEADVEDDPYNLPVSHLVALEGMVSLKRHPSTATAKLAEDSNR